MATTMLANLECGIIASNLLFGFFTMQVLVYFQTYPRDRRSVKATVAIVWLLELGNSVCLMQALYVATITRRSQHVRHNRFEGISISFYFGSTATAVVQAFYSNRLKNCLEKPHLGIFCWCLTIFRFLAFVIESILDGVLNKNFVSKWGSIAGYFIEATIDLIITTSLFYYLIKNRRSCIHTSTIRLLDKIIILTIPTGLITSIDAIILATWMLKIHQNTSYIAFALCHIKIFAISMLASLNGRSMMRLEAMKDTRNSGRLNLGSQIIDFAHPSVELSTIFEFQNELPVVSENQILSAGSSKAPADVGANPS